MSNLIHLQKYPITMVGSKRAIIAELWPRMPRPTSGRVIVPFFGTGADSYFFGAQGLRVIGSDAQPLLVDLHNDALFCYDACDVWIRTKYDRTKEQYFALRADHNARPTARGFYLLSSLSFNGLIRHNRAGGFNVPPGSLPASPLPARASMEEHARFITSIDGVTCADFRAAVARAQPGDFVYLDPPYYGTFDGYTGQPFDHPDLFEVLDDLTDQGIAWACSNSLAAAAHMPAQATVSELTRSGAFNGDVSKRGKVTEILATWSPAKM